MYAPPQLLALIEDRLAELGMSQAQLGLRAFGKADNTAIQSLKKGSSPAIDRLEAMAAAIGWEVYFGPPRPKLSALNEPSPDNDFASANPMRAGFSSIPWFEAKLGSGSAPVAFLDTWLASNGLILDNLAAATATKVHLPGFEPNKTLVLIDTSAPRRGFALWLVQEPGETSVASVSFEGEDLLLLNESQLSPPRLIRDWRRTNTRLAGRVVWLGLQPNH